MDETNVTQLTPFDAMVSQESMQLMKASLPYLPVNMQRMLAIYAKFTELTNTISYFRQMTPELQMMSSPKAMQPLDLLNEIKPYTGRNMQNNIDQILMAFNTMQFMQSFQENPEENQEGV